jgi:putative ABC transport system ATP-binding protein
MPRKRAVDQASSLLAELGLEQRLHALPSQLSGGQQQRVALARALVHDPRLVMCDEPTAALDHHTGQTAMELLTKVAVRPGRAVIVVTHDNRIFDFADRIAHMDDGRIVNTETSRSMLTAASLHQFR